MKRLKSTILVMSVFLASGLIGGIPFAGADSSAPLFINLTTDDLHRANMALSIAKDQSARGHNVTIFLNDKGVFLASRNASKYQDHQKILGELMARGVIVYVCPFCLKHYEIPEADLISGVKQSTPELIDESLFKDKSRTLTW